MCAALTTEVLGALVLTSVKWVLYTYGIHRDNCCSHKQKYFTECTDQDCLQLPRELGIHN